MAPFVAESRLQQAGGAGKDEVRCRGGDDDQVDIGRGRAGHFHRALTGEEAQIARRLPFIGEMPGTDTGARHDPFVVGIDATRDQVVV